MKQTYQQIVKILLEDIIELNNFGVESLNEINFEGFSGDYQKYFFKKYEGNPERYELLDFDKNKDVPYSRELSKMITGFNIGGFLDVDYKIHFKKIENYLNRAQ